MTFTGCTPASGAAAATLPRSSPGRPRIGLRSTPFFDDRGTEARHGPRCVAPHRRHQARRDPAVGHHQVNITAITGIVPAMGEAVVVRAGKSERWRWWGGWRWVACEGPR